MPPTQQSTDRLTSPPKSRQREIVVNLLRWTGVAHIMKPLRCPSPVWLLLLILSVGLVVAALLTPPAPRPFFEESEYVRVILLPEPETPLPTERLVQTLPLW